MLATQVVVLAGIPTPSLAQASEETSVNDIPAGATELLDRRSERSKTFLNPDGSYTLRSFTGPVHYQAASGAWEEIDTTLVASDRAAYAWRNSAGAFTAYFAAAASSEDMVLVTDTTSSISFGFDGADPNSAAVVDGSKITYPSIKPGIDLVYEVRNGEVKELIVLRQAPSEPLTLDFPLELDNLTAQEAGSGAVKLITDAGDLGFTISDVWMIDSSRQAESGEPAFSEDLTSELSGPVGAQTLSVTPDYDWLTAPERVYPVTIDPTTTKTTNDDTYVQSNICCTDVSGENEVKSGTYDSGATKARSLMKFADVQNQVPSGASITGANLFVYEFHSWSCNPTNVSVHRIDAPWDGNSVRWGNQPPVAAAAWTVNVAKGFSSSCSAGWVTFESLGSMVQYWRANNNNYGIEIRSPNETNNDWWKKWRPLGSGNAPYLEVYYTEPDTTGPGKPTISSSTHSPSSTWFSNASPSFNWTTPSDPSGIEGYSVKLDQSSNTMPDNSIDIYGNSTSYGAQTSGEWWFHVRAKDGAGNWSPDWDDYKIRIDTLAPQWGSPAVSSSTHPSETSWSQSNDPCFSWSASDSYSLVAGYSYELTTNSGATPDTNIETAGTSACFSDYGDGSWYFRIRAKDNAGNWSSVANYTIKIDYNPATPSISSSTHSSPDTWYASRNPSFNWSAADESGISGYSYQLTSGSPTTPDATSEGTGTSTSYSGLSDGEWWFNVRAQNGVGTWGAATSRRVRIDGSAPSVSLSSTTHSNGVWSNNNDPSVSFGTSDLSGINGYSFLLDLSAATIPDGIVDSTSGNTSYTDVSDGISYFHVRAQNGAGLWSEETRHFELRIDTVAPNVPDISSATHPTEGTVYRSNDPSFSWTATDARSGVSAYSFELDQNATTTPDTVSEGSLTSKSYNDLADGTWWFHVRAKDAAGNWGAANHFRAVIDIPAPDINPTLTGPEGQIDADDEPVVKNGDVLTFSGAITEGAGGPLDMTATITQCDLVVKNDAGTEVKRISLPSSNCRNDAGSLTGSASPSDLVATSGTIHLEVVVTRTQGNLSESSGVMASPALLLDNAAPGIRNVVMGCGGYLLTLACEETKSVIVSLSEDVRGDFGPQDFAVDSNVVLASQSSCAATTFCDRVTLTLGSAISETSFPSLRFSHVAVGDRIRPRDGVGHGLADSSTLVTDGDTDPSEGDVVLEPIIDPADPPALLPTTPAGEVLVVTANALQASADDAPANCTAADPDDAGFEQLKKCNANGTGGREDRFADRIKKLVLKPVDEDVDAMRYVPDVILLQETRAEDARNIVRYLNGKIKVEKPDGTETNDVFAVGKASSVHIERLRKEGKTLPGKVRVRDTAIIFNKQTMERLFRADNDEKDTGTYVDLEYTKEEQRQGNRCNDSEGAALFIDIELIGVNSCKNLIHKRNFLMGFQERETVTGATAPYKIAVASIHFPNGANLKDGMTHNAKAEEWANQVARRFTLPRYAEVNRLFMSGDFNIERCRLPQEDPLVPDDTAQEEFSACTQRPWYNATIATNAFTDAIFAVYGSDEAALNRQYSDGSSSRELRIDFIFTKELVPLALQPTIDASHDITCGFADTQESVPDTCDDLRNTERYSDHRLVWGFVGLDQPDPEPSITPLPTITPLPPTITP